MWLVNFSLSMICLILYKKRHCLGFSPFFPKPYLIQKNCLDKNGSILNMLQASSYRKFYIFIIKKKILPKKLFIIDNNTNNSFFSVSSFSLVVFQTPFHHHHLSFPSSSPFVSHSHRTSTVLHSCWTYHRNYQ